MNTLTLDSITWDLVKDASGNIALATDAQAIAQDVASAIRLFVGELWYDVLTGVPYYTQVFNQPYGPALVKGLLSDAALRVPGVVSVQVTITSFTNRLVTGDIKVIDATGQSLNVHF